MSRTHVVRAAARFALGLAVLLSAACTKPSPPSEPKKGAEVSRVEPDGKVLCAVTGEQFRRPVCLEPIDDTIAARTRDHEVLIRVGGRFVRQESRNSSGALEPSSDGVAIKVTMYEGDEVKERSFQDAAANVLFRVVYGPDGHAAYVDRHDRRVTPFTDREATGYVSKFDARGNVVETMYVDTVGKPSSGGFQTPVARNVVDAKDRIVGNSYHTADGQPMLGSGGYHSARMEHTLDCERSRRLFGLKGERVLGKSGHSGYLQDCDSLGRAMGGRYVGLNDEPRVDENGIAGWKNLRDDKGNLMERMSVTLDGKPTAGTLDHAIVRYEYDRNGRTIAKHYLGADGSPAVMVRTLVASQRFTYDPAGRVLSESLLGVRGRPQRGFANWAIMRHVRNALGKIKRTEYFDEEDRPALTNDGYASVTFAFDRFDQVFETGYRGVDGRLVRTVSGFAVEQTEYSSEGQPTVHRYFDEHDQPIKITRAKLIIVKHSQTGAGAKLRTRDEALAIVQDARKRLVAGEPWKLVAPKVSDESGWRQSSFVGGRVFPQIRAAVAAAKPGEVTAVIETPNGFFLYFLDP